MTDTKTKFISLALYRYMCQNIVGTENHVKNIRLMTAVRDNINSNSGKPIITSGSFGEGLDMRGSDLDIMFVSETMGVNADIKTAFNSKLVKFSMETDDVKVGFTQLLVEDMNQYLCGLYEEHNGKHYLSGALYKQKLLGKTDSVVHGPCLTDKAGWNDVAYCLHCKTWISQASQWITRSNNSWPSYNVKQSIIKHGVLFVPIGIKGSPKEDIEWRISFSLGEKFLINTFTHTQLICYALLKILLKDVIATYTECKDLLCSYFLKTTVFWISEELPQSIWKPEHLIHCFMRCLGRLVYSVDYSICLHYFIPENNMFENKIEGRAREKLLETLYNLHSYGWRCILFSDQVSNFHDSMCNINIEPHILHANVVGKIINSFLLYLSTAVVYRSQLQSTAYKRGIHQIVSCNKSLNKYINVYYLSLKCSSLVWSISLDSTKSNNKHQYKQYKSGIGTLLQNIHHDAMSGWLMLASFFYKYKQYSNALHIITYSISKCTPEKMYRFMDISHVRLFDLQVFQRKSVVLMLKLFLVDSINFTRSSWLIPYELQMKVQNRPFTISAIVYAYFLTLLCHYHFNNVRQCQDCLQTLQLVISENYFIGYGRSVIASAYNILGIASQLLGDSESARQAFMQSHEIYPNADM